VGTRDEGAAVFSTRCKTSSASARELEAPPGVPLPLGDGSGEGAVPLPRKFLNFYIKMACSGTLWSMDFKLNHASPLLC